MNFFVFPREIREINKQGEGGGGQNKLGVSKNHQRNKRRLRLFWTWE